MEKEKVDEYTEKRAEMTSDKMFWEAWDFVEKEFGSMWRSLSLDDKRALAVEKYENLCGLREIEPYSRTKEPLR